MTRGTRGAGGREGEDTWARGGQAGKRGGDGEQVWERGKGNVGGVGKTHQAAHQAPAASMLVELKQCRLVGRLDRKIQLTAYDVRRKRRARRG